MDINKFLGGLDSDAHPSQQKEHTIRYGLNFVPMSEEGNLYSITNESGTVEMTNIRFPAGFKPIGHSVLNNEIIVVLCDPFGNSQFGYIIEDDSPDPVYGFYHPSGPVDAAGNVLANNKELKFEQINPIDCVSRKLINGHRLLYFTDNKVPYGFLDLNNPPIEGSVAETVKLTFDQSIPKISVVEIVEGVLSSIRPGVVQFITRYVTATGGVTIFGLPSEVFPIIPSDKNDGVSSYEGGFYEDGVVNKNLRIQFDNVDTKYQELEVVALYYESSASIFKASIVGQLPITSDSIEFTYTGPNVDSIINLTSAELQQVIISYTHAKCIEQKNNTLFLSNLRDERANLSQNLQEVANKIKVKYRIKSIPFSGRGDDRIVTVLGFAPVGNPYISGDNIITLNMSENVDPLTGGINTLYQLNKIGNVAVGTIVLGAVQPLVGDTIVITPASTYVGSQIPITITAIAVGATPAANEFAIGATLVETALNIYLALKDIGDITEFNCVYDSNLTITLSWFSIDLTVNTSTIVFTSTATSPDLTTTAFAGADNVASSTIATTAVVSGNEITITFPVGTTVLSVDEFCIIGNGIASLPDFTNVSPYPFSPYYSSTGTSSYWQSQYNAGTAIPIYGTLDSLYFNVYQSGSIGNGLSILPESLTSGGTGSNTNGFTDYTNEFLTATTKGYRRGEVYSLAFKIIWKDGSMSPAYHIPGNSLYGSVAGTNPPVAPDVWPTTNIGNGAGVGYVGTYVSEDTYSLDRGYPGDDVGDDNTEQGLPGFRRNIRHHYMPNLENEPHFTKSTIGKEVIRVLGLDFEFGIPIPPEIVEEADEIVFLRERRNTANNKSIYAQGLVHKHMITADQFDNDGLVDGNGISENILVANDVYGAAGTASPFNGMKSSYCVVELPFFNLNMSVTGLNAFYDNGSSVRAGMVNSFRDLEPFSPAYNTGRKMKSQAIANQVIFHSPESNLLTGFKLNADNIESFTLSQELTLKGKISRVSFKPDIQKSETGNLIANRHTVDRYLFADLFCNYNEIENVAIDQSTVNRTVEKARYLEKNVRRIESIEDVNHPALKTNTRWNQGGLQLLLNDNIFSPEDNSSVPADMRASINIVNSYNPSTSNDQYKGVSTLQYIDNAGSVTTIGSDTVLDNIRNLYNLKVVNTKQYGQLQNTGYIPIARKAIKNTSTGVFIDSYTSVFGGDTFITKYAFNAGNVIPYDPLRDTGRYPISSNRSSFSQRKSAYLNIDNINDNRIQGWDFRTCTYYFVESNINTNYRHTPESEDKQDYFPNQKNIAKLLDEWFPYLGQIQAYNTQYSYENNVIESFLAGSTSETISDFENRTIYSEKAAEDDTLDAYRSFLVKDFYDLPSEKGPIWDTFVEYNTLFMHTPKALWKTFAETQATIKGGNIADAVLGTSSLFARPSEEVLETEGGYGGSISQFGGAHTQLGYIFADVLQGKIFLLGVTKTGGTVLNEISKAGISTEMHKNLPLGIIKDSAGNTDLSNITTLKANLIDNPYLGIGITAGYDYKLSRYIIVKFPVVGQSPGFTLSYSKDIGKWFNYHSYKPNIIIPYNNRLFFVDNKNINSKFHEMNIGPKGSYFGTVYNSELTYVIAAKGQTCIFNNIVINSVSTDKTTGIKKRDDNFEEITVYNQKVNTGPYEMVPDNTFGITLTAGQVSIKHRNDEYRIAIPRDSVIDNSLNIFDPTNLDNTVKFREKIKGNYAIVNLKYDNTADLQFVINFIKNIFTNNFR